MIILKSERFPMQYIIGWEKEVKRELELSSNILLQCLFQGEKLFRGIMR